MNDEPRTLTKEQIRQEWANEPLAGKDDTRTLKFNLVILEADSGTRTVSQVIRGNEVPFSSFVVGDLTDRSKEVEAYLTRLLGMVVRIETGEE